MSAYEEAARTKVAMAARIVAARRIVAELDALLAQLDLEEREAWDALAAARAHAAIAARRLWERWPYSQEELNATPDPRP